MPCEADLSTILHNLHARVNTLENDNKLSLDAQSLGGMFSSGEFVVSVYYIAKKDEYKVTHKSKTEICKDKPAVYRFMGEIFGGRA